jgi:hypothetical protein
MEARHERVDDLEIVALVRADQEVVAVEDDLALRRLSRFSFDEKLDTRDVYGLATLRPGDGAIGPVVIGGRWGVSRLCHGGGSLYLTTAPCAARVNAKVC